MWLKIALQLIRASYESVHQISAVAVSLKRSRQPSRLLRRFKICLKQPPLACFSQLAQVARTPHLRAHTMHCFLSEAEAGRQCGIAGASARRAHTPR